MVPSGKIIIPAGASIWPHELKTAEALSAAGYTVEFVDRIENDFHKNADIRINGLVWEMKAPNSSQLSAVERNLRRACRQSSNIVFDSIRMKPLPDKAIERELRKWAIEIKSVRHLLFVSRRREVIAIL